MPDHIIRQIQTARTPAVIIPTEGSHKAFFISQLFLDTNKNMVIIARDRKKAAQFLQELEFFLPEHQGQLVLFPSYNILPFKSLSYHKQTSIDRLAALSKMMHQGSKPFIIITTVRSMLQKLIPRTRMDHFAELIMANEETDRDALISKLESGGYTKTSLVEDPGEYSVRGGILDIFCPGETHPVRMEFFGDLVESMRYFNVYTQRGIKEVSEIIVLPATEAVVTEEEVPHIIARLRQAGTIAGLNVEKIREYVTRVREFNRFSGIESMLSIVYEQLDTIFDYLPESSLLIQDLPEELAARGMDVEDEFRLNYQSTAAENRLCVAHEDICLKWDQVDEQMGACNCLPIKSFDVLPGQVDDDLRPAIHLDYQDNNGLSQALKREGVRENLLKPLIDWFEEQLKNNRAVVCVLSQKAQVKRLRALLAPYGVEPLPGKSFPDWQKKKKGVYYLLGNLASGFVYPGQGIALVSENEIFGKQRVRRQAARRKDVKTRFITPEELKKGDIVVHLEHGIGKYQGLCSLALNGLTHDFILILYQDDDKLYLPVDRIEMIGKYIGVDGYTPILDKIGSKSWIRAKVKAKQEVEKLAADLLDLYAKRRVHKGFAFSQPDNYTNEFEAGFIHEETRDQLKAIDDVHLDMESDTPMDRLVCGDVGYGKTEVAIRAAFKAVNDARQVAFVVPTTILAEQHLSTFKERMANYPIHIECLSRFRSKAQQTDIIKRMKSGVVDIVIGTHRLLQKDIEFKSLGLLMIDEEQRFGVKHKETLKKKRASVDVLALTATPIPRTLHLSLTGMRDISVITTPPADRQPIISYISEYDETIIKEAVSKELDRKGQVFFVHNNIKTIDKMARQIETLVPHAKVGVAHGRLSESELETMMFKFVHFEINVLVATTIIESGLDIPSANTMIINKAERFGLSQIYQLRGRIGRGDHQAYAYLFISNETLLTKDAKKRLSALMEHKDLGSGFQIAMKDLQIRGAGSALGASQSGHIAAVGYDMFLKLLDHAVHDLKGEDVVTPLEPEINVSISSGFSDTYIASVEQRLTLYRRLSKITHVGDIQEMKKELVDRYGALPKEAENMLLKIMLRVYCIKAGVGRLDVTAQAAIITFSLPHLKLTVDQLQSRMKGVAQFKFVKKESIKIVFGKKRSNVSRAILETRNILKALSADF